MGKRREIMSSQFKWHLALRPLIPTKKSYASRDDFWAGVFFLPAGTLRPSNNELGQRRHFTKIAFRDRASDRQNDGYRTNIDNSDMEIIRRHVLACKEKKACYVDPETGYMVFTELYLKKRGYCCGNECRHCPYGHQNVPEHLRTKKFNSFFYK